MRENTLFLAVGILRRKKKHEACGRFPLAFQDFADDFNGKGIGNAELAALLLKPISERFYCIPHKDVKNYCGNLNRSTKMKFFFGGLCYIDPRTL